MVGMLRWVCYTGKIPALLILDTLTVSWQRLFIKWTEFISEWFKLSPSRKHCPAEEVMFAESRNSIAVVVGRT